MKKLPKNCTCNLSIKKDVVCGGIYWIHPASKVAIVMDSRCIYFRNYTIQLIYTPFLVYKDHFTIIALIDCNCRRSQETFFIIHTLILTIQRGCWVFLNWRDVDNTWNIWKKYFAMVNIIHWHSWWGSASRTCHHKDHQLKSWCLYWKKWELTLMDLVES